MYRPVPHLPLSFHFIKEVAHHPAGGTVTVGPGSTVTVVPGSTVTVVPGSTVAVG